MMPIIEFELEIIRGKLLFIWNIFPYEFFYFSIKVLIGGKQ